MLAGKCKLDHLTHLPASRDVALFSSIEERAGCLIVLQQVA